MLVYAAWRARARDGAQRRRAFAIRWVSALAAALSPAAAPAVAEEAGSLLERAIACELGEAEIATLLERSAAADPGMRKPAQALAAPSGDLYRLTRPIGALGYTASEVFVAPGRIAIAVPGEALEKVAARLRLTPEPFGPAQRGVDDGRTLIAYQLSQAPLAGKVLVGCQYADPAALAWAGRDDGLF